MIQRLSTDSLGFILHTNFIRIFNTRRYSYSVLLKKNEDKLKNITSSLNSSEYVGVSVGKSFFSEIEQMKLYCNYKSIKLMFLNVKFFHFIHAYKIIVARSTLQWSSQKIVLYFVNISQQLQIQLLFFEKRRKSRSIVKIFCLSFKPCCWNFYSLINRLRIETH